MNFWLMPTRTVDNEGKPVPALELTQKELEAIEYWLGNEDYDHSIDVSAIRNKIGEFLARCKVQA